MIQFPIYGQNYNSSVNTNLYRQQLEHIMNTNLQHGYQLYYPDLTYDEYNASPLNRNVMLYERGKLEQLAKYGSFTNCGNIYNEIKDNSDFKELINSQYFKSPEGFVRIINNLNNLKIKRQQKLSYYYNPAYQKYYNANMNKPIPYEKYDMKDYLKILNDFSKNNKISDDLKQYFLYMKSDNIDLYYTKLDKLAESQNPMEILIYRMPYIEE